MIKATEQQPNDKQPEPQKVEKRVFNIQLRAAGEGDPAEERRSVTGYAALFNSASEDMGFIEIIEPGAFRNAIPKSDIRALFNHDPSQLLARTASSTLKVQEDTKGLRYDFELPDTTLGNDLKIMLKRGDVSQSSFAFSVKEQSWESLKLANGEMQYTRRIKEIEELYDVSLVTYPAYADTEVALRSMPGRKAETDGNQEVPAQPEKSQRARLLEAIERSAKCQDNE